jgi:hypothetical protein
MACENDAFNQSSCFSSLSPDIGNSFHMFGTLLTLVELNIHISTQFPLLQSLDKDGVVERI